MGAYRLTSEARDELNGSVSFYNSEYSGLGQDFAFEVRRLCRRIAKAPEAGFEVRPDVRRRIVRRFPYSVLYTVESGEVVVLAIAHQSRKPGYWIGRV